LTPALWDTQYSQYPCTLRDIVLTISMHIETQHSQSPCTLTHKVLTISMYVETHSTHNLHARSDTQYSNLHARWDTQYSNLHAHWDTVLTISTHVETHSTYNLPRIFSAAFPMTGGGPASCQFPVGRPKSCLEQARAGHCRSPITWSWLLWPLSAYPAVRDRGGEGAVPHTKAETGVKDDVTCITLNSVCSWWLSPFRPSRRSENQIYVVTVF
jgi:hypothetical protein